MALDRDGALWFSHFGGNYIGRFNPANDKFSIYPHASPDVNCRQIDIAKDGSLWCIGSEAAKLVHLTVKPAR